jgi:hypothetical protein
VEESPGESCPAKKRMFISMDVTFTENRSFYGEPTDLTHVFPNMFTSDIPYLNYETEEDKGEENQITTSRETVVGVIPREYVHDDVCDLNAEQDQVQGEHQDTSNETMELPRFNEEQNLQVYSQRHRQETLVVQEQEETSPSLTRSNFHGSSPQNDGTHPFSDDLDIPIALINSLVPQLGNYHQICLHMIFLIMFDTHLWVLSINHL